MLSKIPFIAAFLFAAMNMTAAQTDAAMTVKLVIYQDPKDSVTRFVTMRGAPIYPNNGWGVQFRFDAGRGGRAYDSPKSNAYRVDPLKEGEFLLMSYEYEKDGQRLRTKPKLITAGREFFIDLMEEQTCILFFVNRHTAAGFATN